MTPASSQPSSMRNALAARLAICLFVGVVMFWGTFGTIDFVEKLIRDGSEDAVAGVMRVVAGLTVGQFARLIGIAMGSSLIACFPVYVVPVRASLAHLLLCAALATIMLAGCFSFEGWYASGLFRFPPPGLLAVLVLVALASAVTSRALLARLWRSRRMR